MLVKLGQIALIWSNVIKFGQIGGGGTNIHTYTYTESCKYILVRYQNGNYFHQFPQVLGDLKLKLDLA